MNRLTHAVVLDDHRLFADSFALLLQKECGIDMVQAFSETEGFYQFLRAFGQGELYVFLDYYFPQENGLVLSMEIKRLNSKAKVIFVTSATSESVIRSILQYRPNGLLSKSCDMATLVACMDQIRAGGFYVGPRLMKILENNVVVEASFTPRELELLKYFSKGYSIAETANHTFLSPHTIVAHRRKMMAKARCNRIEQLLSYAQQHQLL